MRKVLLIDDEETGLDILEILLSEFEEIEVSGRYTDPVEALERLKVEIIDAVFLDIEMPEISGMEFARRVQEMNEQTKIIFVTAHMDFAVEAFEIESLDYILKPVTKARLHQSVRRILHATNKHKPKDSSISIRCFGHFDVYSHDENETLTWKTNKVRELCAYLIHFEGNLVERDRIIDTLWPEVPVDKARTSLYTNISYLRSTFKEHGFENVIMKKDSCYYINLLNFKCDLIEWKNLNNTIENISQENKHLFEKILDIYKDEYMAKSGYSWAEEKRQYICKNIYTVNNQLAKFYNGLGEIEKFLEYTEKEMELSRYSDEICQRLIKIHLEMKNRTAALIVYHNFVQVLQEELGIEPSLQTKRMLQQIINES
ncbi:hypothetical protein BHU72_09875 [Desulfuribacillus stibiiarsenatis]|uniref:Response regulatory domain-containing protein n=1 Tax=Desulfuribacillus stibiiarsenatis TaxID=1390249 RepID=A0A1E5L345_9FIRM|nr:response regulator [Desulfuribacillus stibiiarsenatis]OEH84504.1 hypothetical protein BHU72_09875 [Desulfuribacillus stibiiarsenatis]